MKKLITNLLLFISLKFGIVIFLPFQIKKNIIVSGGNGLFVINKNNFKLKRVAVGKSYGMFVINNCFHFFLTSSKKNTKDGYIFKTFDMFGYIFFATKISFPISKGCHQIVVYDNKIHITDTYNNKILIINNKYELIETILCLKEVNSRPDVNYKHVNSLYIDENYIYCLFHNETSKTGKNSQLCRIGKAKKDKQIIDTVFGCAHNIVRYNNEFLICDSLGSKIFLGDKVFLKLEGFTRGLLIYNDKLFIGESHKKKLNKDIHFQNKILVYDLKNKCFIKTINFKTQIYEFYNI